MVPIHGELNPLGLVVTVIGATALKLAVTLIGPLMVTDPGLDPAGAAPVQLEKTKPLAAEAVSCTDVPLV